MQIYSGLLLAYSTVGVNKWTSILLTLPYDVKIEGFITRSILSQHEHNYHIRNGETILWLHNNPIHHI